MKNLFLLATFVFTTVYSYGQVKIGDNHETIDANSLLELESTDKGLLFPRLALTATDNVAPLAAHIEGMVVYNTATAGSGATGVSPGMYYNSGTAWEKINSASSTLPGAPIGSVVTMAADVVPNGYLYCDGSAVSRTTYADLFAVVSTLYGAGDGSATFNLPDYRGYFLRGQDDGRALDPDAAARTGGDAIGSTQTDAAQHVTGSFGDNFSGSFVNSSDFATGAFQLQNYVGRYSQPLGGGGHSGANFDNSRVVRTSSETRPVNISVRYCIKFQETEYAGAVGPTGTAGANGSDGNGVLNGAVDPTSEGVDGDFYINTATNYIFGPKASGTWPAGTSISVAANTVGPVYDYFTSADLIPNGAIGLNVANEELNTGNFSIVSGNLQVNVAGTYWLQYSSQWQNATGFNVSGELSMALNSTIVRSTFGTCVEIDGVGSRSGGTHIISKIMTLSVGDIISFSSNNANFRYNDQQLTIIRY